MFKCRGVEGIDKGLEEVVHGGEVGLGATVGVIHGGKSGRLEVRPSL